MYSFFDKSIHLALGHSFKRAIFNRTQEIQVTESRQLQVTIIKMLADKQDVIKIKSHILNEIIKPNPNSLFVFTTPSLRHGDNFIYPGHNASFLTDEKGQVSCSMSKRPSKNMLRMMQPVPDIRFKNNDSQARMFEAQYTSINDELDTWVKKAISVVYYPAFFHIIPLANKAGFRQQDYENNVRCIREENSPYILRSYINPYNNQYVPAKNCNIAVEHSIFGRHSETTHDMFCQEAVIHLIERVLEKNTSYRDAVETLGLTEGIESSAIPGEKYDSLTMVI